MAKSSKKKKSAKTKTEMPDLVAVMAKFLERLEALEKKTDLLVSRVSSLPSELRSLVPSVPRPLQHHHSGQNPKPNQPVPREKVMYDAVCADCCKSCRVPFKPSGNRPVYCPECFAIRKAGHVPHDPTAHVKPPMPPKQIIPAALAAKAQAETKSSAKGKHKPQKPAKKKKK